MFSLRTHLIISGALFGALMLVAAGGDLLTSLDIVHVSGRLRSPAFILVFGLFLAFGFSLPPVLVKSVMGVQRRMGAADSPQIRRLVAGDNLIIWLMWAVMAAGLIVALPAMLRDGFFG